MLTHSLKHSACPTAFAWSGPDRRYIPHEVGPGMFLTPVLPSHHHRHRPRPRSLAEQCSSFPPPIPTDQIRQDQIRS